EFARGKIIHEEHRRCALHRNVINAVVHQIGADRVMNVHLEGQLELRADAVYARNQHRINVLSLIHREQTAKAANFAQHALRERLMRQILDALLGPVSLIYVDARVRVSDRFGRSWGHDVLKNFTAEYARDRRAEMVAVNSETGGKRGLILARRGMKNLAPASGKKKHSHGSTRIFTD